MGAKMGEKDFIQYLFQDPCKLMNKEIRNALKIVQACSDDIIIVKKKKKKFSYSFT